MIVGLDGKQISAGEMIPWDGKDESVYKEASPIQLKHIELMYDAFLQFIRDDELFADGVPDMTFSVSKMIRVG